MLKQLNFRPAGPVLGLCLALAACSSGGGSGSEDPAPTTSGGAAVSAGVDGSTVAPGPDPATVQSPESIREYYRKLGVAEPVIDCYVAALAEIGVTSLGQLEDDQELGAEAADRFDRCVVETGGQTTATG